MLNLNYSIHHSLFSHELIKDLKGNQRRCTVIIWSMIIHFYRHSEDHNCWFYQRQWCEDWGFHQRDARAAIRFLIDNNMIKQVSAYQRTTHKPAVYTVDTGCVHIVHKLYPQWTKAVSTVDTVNNNKKLLKGKQDSFMKSLPPHQQKQYAAAVEREGPEKAKAMVLKMISNAS